MPCPQRGRSKQRPYKGAECFPICSAHTRHFRLTATFGGAAGIAEMLLQSHAGEIHLLPALPDAWASGGARGLCARGAFEVSIEWRSGRLLSAEIRSKAGRDCVVRYGDRAVALKTEAGKTYRFDAQLNQPHPPRTG